jgi:methyl-accepting chemotaxis protein
MENRLKMGLKRELSEMRKTLEDLTSELRETNLAIRDSLKLTSNAIKEMSETFSKTLGDTLKVMQDMRVQIDVRDSVVKSLGIDGLIPDIFKKKK